jgi:hypothetical protein
MIMPAFVRLYKTDYAAEYSDLLENLAITFNLDGENVYNALTNSLTIADNMLSVVTDVTVSVNANGIPKSLTQISLNNVINQIEAVQVGYASNTTSNTTYPTGAPFISFTQSQNLITINHITGLTPNDNWSLHVIIYGAS